MSDEIGDKKSGPSQNEFLSALQSEKISVSIYLVNGIKLQGQIESFDQHVIFLRNTTMKQMVYKHAISTIVPLQPLVSHFGASKTLLAAATA